MKTTSIKIEVNSPLPSGLFVWPLPWNGQANPQRARDLFRFNNALHGVKPHHRAEKIHLVMNRVRSQRGMPQRSWAEFVARQYFRLTFVMNDRKISWRTDQ